MNMMLTAAAIRSLAALASAELERVADAAAAPPQKHAAPFSKTEAGRKRRDERRKTIKRKRAFFD